MIRISFVVPVYNVELYLEKCILSLLDQDIPYSDYEIIVVNDGSTDHSGEIIDRLSESYSIIKIIHQENKGLSEARNAGLKIASGKYVWFVDSDDSIVSNCLAELLRLCEDNDLELLDMIMMLVDESGNEIREKKYIPLFPYNQVVGGAEYLNNYIFNSGVCHYLFARDFFQTHNLSFTSGIYHEDEEFTPQALFGANRIMVINKVTYFYFQRNQSIIRTTDEKAINKKKNDLFSVIYSLSAFASKQEGQVDLSLLKGLRRRIGMLSIEMIRKISTNCDPSFLLACLQEMKNRGVYPIKYTPKGIKYRLFTPFMNCPFLLTTLIRLKKWGSMLV
ncbi:hypothetical protein FACS189423_09230 [Bacteroidia bacterium]|nr:hypothetical protein FACS189423_09230 [Bacteroidia bacterium]